MNLVAALVRGMQVEDALLQLQLTVKRAAKTVYQVICEQLVSKERKGFWCYLPKCSFILCRSYIQHGQMQFTIMD